MKRFKGTVSYDGHSYIGWQSQLKHNSIQELIEEAISKVADTPIKITGASRTDARVNALGQVFHFDTDRDDIEGWQWQRAINNYLPDDIYIRSVEEVDDNFFARYGVKRKQYDYVINQGEYNVFIKDRTFYFPYDLDIQKMEEASKVFVGKHDFTSFCTSPLEEYPDQVRTIESITFKKENDILTISFVGEGFLRYMVRMMSATLIEVGRGKTSAEEVQAMLDAKSKLACKRNAKPQGLTLVSIEYYKIFYKNKELIIREYIDRDMDELKFDLSEATKMINDKLPHIMTIATRHGDNKAIGYFQIDTQNNGLTVSTVIHNGDNYQEDIGDAMGSIGDLVMNTLDFDEIYIDYPSFASFAGKTLKNRGYEHIEAKSTQSKTTMCKKRLK